ncbi:MAG: hypothetical protein C4519_10635 [Desulfobacteraceae bacterium]|nr:MAG: hypothetical protein C4519_10635 [Desulfobacteraceae bacterium]
MIAPEKAVQYGGDGLYSDTGAGQLTMEDFIGEQNFTKTMGLRAFMREKGTKMVKSACAVLLAGYAWIVFSGCTSRAWYEGLRDVQRQECYRIESAQERQECLDKANNTSYDRYEKDRRGSQSRPWH